MHSDAPFGRQSRDPGSPHDEEIRAGMRLLPLTMAQRQRHLHAIAGAETEGRDMDFVRRRSRGEFAVVLTLILVIGVAAVVWTVVLDSSEEPDDSDDLVALAGATLTAHAQGPGPTGTPTGTATSTLPETSWNGVCTPDAFVLDLPAGLPVGDPSYPDWYGSRESGLWVAPLYRNALLPQGLALPADRWFAGGTTYLMWYGTTDPIQVAGRQLDGAGQFESQAPPSMNAPIRTQWTEFEIPSPGCWAITGRAGDLELTVVAEVLFHADRPDVIAAKLLHLSKPYPAPETCAESPWVGPDARAGSYFVSYWLEDASAGIAASEQSGWFVADQQNTLIVTGVDTGETFAAAIEMEGDGSTREAVTSTEQRNTHRLVRVTFPTAGCWTLEIAAGERVASFVVYVYPAECVPQILDGSAVAQCPRP